IITEAYGHITSSTQHQDLQKGWYAAIAVIIVSIFVDISRSRALAKAARKFNSQALESDALHFGTELLSSTAVLIGLLTVKFAGKKFWTAAPMAAMVAAGIMIFPPLRLGRRAADILVARAPPGVEQQVHSLILRVPGARDVSRIRARQSGARTFVDATI